MKIVTPFTMGHSVTLLLGAAGAVHVPEPLIETAIVLSIFVSAVHALVPIFQGKEIFIAGGFGLVHGLAFAATLTEFGLDPLTMASSVLAFNLGIEAGQLLVILVTIRGCCWRGHRPTRRSGWSGLLSQASMRWAGWESGP